MFPELLLSEPAWSLPWSGCTQLRAVTLLLSPEDHSSSSATLHLLNPSAALGFCLLPFLCVLLGSCAPGPVALLKEDHV